MSRKESPLIDSFLFAVEKGQIAAEHEGSENVLRRVAEALRMILDGADPSEAFGIASTDGRPRDAFLDALAFAIHNERERGETWDAIADRAEPAFTRNGREPVSRSRLQSIYRHRKPMIEQREEIAAFFNSERPQ